MSKITLLEICREMIAASDAVMSDTSHAAGIRFYDADKAMREAVAAAPVAQQDLQIECDTLRHGLRLANERISQLEAARWGYASEFPPNADGEPDVGSIHANIRALKKQLATPFQPAQGERQPTMVCSQCGADRFKEDCKGDRMRCDIHGTAQGEREPVAYRSTDGRSLFFAKDLTGPYEVLANEEGVTPLYE